MFSRAATAAEKTPAKKTGPPREVRFFYQNLPALPACIRQIFPIFFHQKLLFIDILSC